MVNGLKSYTNRCGIYFVSDREPTKKMMWPNLYFGQIILEQHEGYIGEARDFR